MLLAPPGVVAAVAGLALLGTLASALQAAMADPAERVAAAVAFVTAASGVVVLGVGAAFWALVAGIVVRAALSVRPVPPPAPAPDGRTDALSGPGCSCNAAGRGSVLLA